MPTRHVIDPASGERVTLPELSRRHNISRSTVRRRYCQGLRGWALVQPCGPWRAWNGRELAFLDTHYPAGMPVAEIARQLDRSVSAVMQRAKHRGLIHPRHCSAQAIRNFEAAHGKLLTEIAREYRDRRLSRTDLAGAIGITYHTLRQFLSDELWQSWPHMTIGRIDAARQRCQAA